MSNLEVGRVRMPSPRAHLAGTLALLRVLAEVSGGHPSQDPLWTFLDRPADLPARVRPEQAGLKYDVYWTQAPQGARWGVAVSDRYEGVGIIPPLQRLVAALPGRYDLAGALALHRRLGGSLVAAVGFDAPQRPPRLKVYLQEDPWQSGLGRASDLAGVLAEFAPGCALPGWCAERAVGVVTLNLWPDGRRSLKVYLGGESPEAASEGGPPEAVALAVRMAQASPLPGGWYYLTIRAEPGEGWRYAINKIYNPVQVGFTDTGPGAAEAWRDVGSLFAAAGNQSALSRLAGALRGRRGLRVLPTATALEGGAGESTDVYLAAWGGDRLGGSG